MGKYIETAFYIGTTICTAIREASSQITIAPSILPKLGNVADRTLSNKCQQKRNNTH